MRAVVVLLLCVCVRADVEHAAEPTVGRSGVLEQLKPMEELHEKIARYIDKIDENNDGFVTSAELESWLKKIHYIENEEIAAEKMKECDQNKDNFLSLDEVIRCSYNVSLTDLPLPSLQEYKSIATQIETDQAVFAAADTTHDGLLSLSELVAFIAPSEFPAVAAVLLAKYMKRFDTNNDGKISVDEFIFRALDSTPEEDNQLVEQFMDLDTDNDAVLTQEELRPWLSPDSDKITKTEAERILRVTDTNKDGVMSRQEILDHATLWDVRQITSRSRSLLDEL
ncbi:unnamed protein product [Calicophoron daubneyi]|uniref:EF-hand domain-containing protein n=1 Tax=Calicophoron daubneyi TaxID=300641 RepID=A0AAV2TKK8_CALDB